MAEHSVSVNTDKLWVEKYRPKTLDDIIMPDDIRTIFKGYVAAEDLPHILAVGPPGTGKSSSARVLTQLIAKHSFDRLCINASADRGIDTVRDSILVFMKSPPNGSKRKIVFLDECDYLTDQAFASLRNPIENPDYNQYLCTRFIMTANMIANIPAYIQSRVQTFVFSEPDKGVIKDRCCEILKTEGISYTDSILDGIISVGYPDVRSIIGSLQQASYDGELHAINTVINTTTVVDLFVRVARSQTLDQAAQARAELRDLISADDISFVRLIPKLLDALMFDPVAYSIAYRHHLVAFRSVNEKHTLMAILADIILARFGYQN